MVVVDIGVSASAIDMIMQSLGGASTHGIFRELLRGETSLLWRKGTSMSLLGGEVTCSVSSHVETDVCVSACAVGVVDSGGSCLRDYAAHFVS